MFNIGTLGHWRKQWQSYMEGPSRGMATIWKGLPIWGFMKRSYCRSDHGGILGGWGPSLRPKNGRWPQFRYQWPLNQDVCDMVLKVWSQANHNIPGSTKKNSHPMKYHRTTEVMSPPSPNSMLSSEFCVWRPSKETAIFCSWCSALPIATLKLGVAGVSKVSPWFHVDGCFFEEPGITTVMDIHCMCVICCVSFQHVHQTWSNVSDSNVVFAHDWYSLVDFHIFSPATTQHIFFQRSFNDISWSNVSRCPWDHPRPRRRLATLPGALQGSSKSRWGARATPARSCCTEGAVVSHWEIHDFNEESMGDISGYVHINVGFVLTGQLLYIYILMASRWLYNGISMGYCWDINGILLCPVVERELFGARSVSRSPFNWRWGASWSYELR